MSPTPLAVAVRGLCMSYNGTRAVDSLDLDAAVGQVTCVLGPNGAGKTTTIESILGLRTPQAGSISVLGRSPADMTAADRARIGVMLQDGGMPSGAGALELLRSTAALYADPEDPARLAGELGLDAFARTPVRRLSGGQRQRLALALALVGRPDLVFLDEPTAGLDVSGRRDVWQRVRDLRERGVSFILTTHLLDEAESLADRIVVIDRGTVVADASPAELTARRAERGWDLVIEPDPDLLDRPPSPVVPGYRLAIEPAAPGRATMRSVHAVPDGVDDRLAPLATALEAGGHRIVQAARIGSTHRSLEEVFLELTHHDDAPAARPVPERRPR